MLPRTSPRSTAAVDDTSASAGGSPPGIALNYYYRSMKSLGVVLHGLNGRFFVRRQVEPAACGAWIGRGGAIYISTDICLYIPPRSHPSQSGSLLHRPAFFTAPSPLSVELGTPVIPSAINLSINQRCRCSRCLPSPRPCWADIDSSRPPRPSRSARCVWEP
ncbi:hypothetical protein VTN02DRAFT_5270 [Thermoascus thermophilus]